MSAVDPSGMWHAIDSTLGHQSYYRRTDGWEDQRNGRCIALRSDGDRCGRYVIDLAGFCGFHFARLKDWFMSEASEQIAARARRDDPSAFQFVIDDARIDDAMRVLEDAEAQVYFIAVGNIAKIGYSRNVLARFHSIRQGSKLLIPDGYSVKDAALLGAIHGGLNVERRLHGLLHNYRLVGEWFRLTPTVIAAIDCLLYDAEPPKAIEAGLRDLYSPHPGSRRRNRRAVA